MEEAFVSYEADASITSNSKDEYKERLISWPPCLNSIIHLKKLVLHECCNYIVLNKPCDFYMDGNHDHVPTVHKLLTYWYPSPSLLMAVDENGAETMKRTLVDIISTLHQWNALPDNTLRPCHQIDYATSGCLLIARSRKAAAIASKAFEDRQVKKTYLAIVVGHVDLSTNSTTSDTSSRHFNGECCTSTQIMDYVAKQKFDGLWGEASFPNRNNYSNHSSKYIDNKCQKNTGGREYHYRRQKRNEAKKGRLGIHGFLPVSSVFLKWQAAMARHYITMDSSMGQQQQHLLLLPTRDSIPNENDNNENVEGVTEQHPKDFVSIEGGGGCQILVPRFSEMQERMLCDSTTVKWKDIKRQSIMAEIVEQFESLCHEYNASLRHNTPPQTRRERKKWSHIQRYNDEKCRLAETSLEDISTEIKNNQDLPTIFQIMEDAVNDHDTFYINASIAEMKPQFRMIIHQDAMENHQDLHYRQYYTATTTRATKAYSAEDSSTLDEETLDFKPALTRCQVLWRGYFYQDGDSRKTQIPVTKILLQPLTGRRHQLRLHMVALGHPILGDFTYQYHPPPNHHGTMTAEERAPAASTASNHGRSFTQRMCLHAHMLNLPLPIARNCDGSQFSGNDVIHATFVAPDPFLITNSEKDNTETLLIKDLYQW
jgi:23S rRNA-/tRNA-specific pseudouridylate synthase